MGDAKAGLKPGLNRFKRGSGPLSRTDTQVVVVAGDLGFSVSTALPFVGSHRAAGQQPGIAGVGVVADRAAAHLRPGQG